MNYYNPYFYSIPATVQTPKVGLLGRLFGKTGITISSILNGTQRALNFANQAIPLVKQVRPMIGNAKTMFKVMNEFKKTEKPKQNTNNIINNNNTTTVNTDTNIEEISNNENIQENTYTTENGPTFFI